MTPQRWQEVSRQFAALLELVPEEREDFLAGLDDADLAAELRQLLEADAMPDDVIDDAMGFAKAVFSREETVIGSRLGPWELVSEIGHGGMSTVYLAHRADHEFRQQVAVKLIRRGMDTEDILRRFKNERQILANLEHPGIARLYGGGSTPDGGPYFVLEYIEDGEPITDYCERRRLSIEERLRLFLEVCSAVQHAHRHLVIHRDIKPGNVLVSSSGEPKLLDFGIAKVLDPEVEDSLEATAAGSLRLLTPGFASPEQVRGEPVTTASDVYSLGVLLCQLLTGHRPIGGKTREEVLRRTCDEEPERPSVLARREAARRQLARKLEGDLDGIVLKAVAKEPSERYGSVEQLREDVDRHLDGWPIRSREGTWHYRAGKFLRRHRIGVASTALVGAVLVAAAIVLVLQSWRLEQERDAAEEIGNLLKELFQIADQDSLRGRDITARELLDHGTDIVNRELGGQPERQVALLETLADLQRKVGLYDQASKVYRKALAVRRQLDTSDSAELAHTLNALGGVLARGGVYDEAEGLFRESLEMRQRLFGETHGDVAASLNNVALVLHDQGRYDQADGVYREALAIDLELLEESHPYVLVDQANLALLLYDCAEYSEAEELLLRILSHRGDHHLTDRDFDTALDQLGRVYVAQGRVEEAEEPLHQALAVRREHYGDEHVEVARSLVHLGTWQREVGETEAAERNLDAALELSRAVLGDEHPEVATHLLELAALYATRAENERAEETYRKSLAILRRAYVSDPDHPLIGRPIAGLGTLLARQGRCLEAEGMLREALDRLPQADYQLPEVRAALHTCEDALSPGGPGGPAGDGLGG